MTKYKHITAIVSAALIGACTHNAAQQNEASTMAKSPETVQTNVDQTQQEGKAVVYQVFTRLFGNKNTTNKPWGTLEENGTGKFNDFDEVALQSIKDLGVSHIWYTGVPHHAVINDYSEYGISADDPDVVKGRAGSPYAVKDYYQVNPDLAIDPANRMAEFEALIERTHNAGMKVIIDIVPNHVARDYQSLNNPAGVSDFGANDDTSVTYSVNNNFYYNPGESFEVPEAEGGYQPLGGDAHPLSDNKFDETPAKWTGNGSRLSQPNFGDWYETVKINYGVRPDGSYDFDKLPANYAQRDVAAHAAFWQGKTLPDSWIKFRDITHFWLDKGVDGFRFDMAEMVPVEFWSFLNSSIKMKNPEAFLVAEVYQPHLYRDYIHLGKMDYLYDKVETYDTLKWIMQGTASTDDLVAIKENMRDIEHHMLHFLENHDEQRIASPDFAGDATHGMPAMVVSTLISTSPTLVYFGQEVGEAASEDAGFGTNTRTTIFDYFGVPAHQRWMNDGKFDGGQSTAGEKALRDFYQRVLNISLEHPAMQGDYTEIHTHNRSLKQAANGYGEKNFAFVRDNNKAQLIVATNLSATDSQSFNLELPAALVKKLALTDGKHSLSELLSGKEASLTVANGIASVQVQLAPKASVVYEVK